MTDVSQHFLDEVRRQLRGHKRLGEGAMAQLQDAELARSRIQFCSDSREAPRRNMRSRFTDFLTTDGEKPDRHRDREFGLAATTTRDELMRWWEQGWGCVLAALDSLTPEPLLPTVYIGEEPLTVLRALNRALAHYAFHVGQIVFLAKHLRSQEWKTLSVPRGESEEFNRKFVEERHRRRSVSGKESSRKS